MLHAAGGHALNRVLHSRDELVAAERAARLKGLCASPDPTKYWDNVAAVEAIEGEQVGHDAPIVDLGCRSGIVLTWLYQRGFRALHGCDVRRPYPPLKAAGRRHLLPTVLWGARMYASQRRGMRRAPVEATGFPAAHFGAATSLSVIEHGVDLEAFAAEAARILRPGGLLVVSTDYWPAPIDVGGLRRFAKADRIFDRAGLEAFCGTAEGAGLRLLGEPELEAGEPVIESDGFRYTYALLAFRREGQLGVKGF